MARLTPEELKAARQRKAEQLAAEEQQENDARERARQEIEQRRQELERRRQEITDHDQELNQVAAQHAKVQSTTDALYTEIDKLAKKSPREQVSQMTVDMTNRAIQGLKALLGETRDEFAEQIGIIVPAGDLPETRDVLLLLGQMRAALARINLELERTRARLTTRQGEIVADERRLQQEQRQMEGVDEEDEGDEDDLMSRILRPYSLR